MMQFTDSHCHLDFTEFSEQLPDLLYQCNVHNIHRIIVPAVNPEHWQRVLTLSKKENAYVKVSCALGIHPWFLILNNKAQTKQLDVVFQQEQLKQILARNSKDIIAIGECGIDVFKAKKSTTTEQTFNDSLRLQQDFFAMQLELAQQYDLPVIVHHCQSHPLILALLKQYPLNKGGVIHAFSGSYQQARDYIDLGFKLGIGGTITYDRAKKTINAIKRLPSSSLLLETDAPAMPIFGQQGMINSPSNIPKIFQALVSIRDESKEVLATQIEENVNQLFF